MTAGTRPDDCAEDASLLAEIIDQMPAGVIVKDEDGALLFANAAAWRSGLEAHVDDHVASPLGGDEVEASGRTFLTVQKPLVRDERALSLSVFLDITERKRSEDQLVRRAHYDDLTGLPNRTLFEQRVAQALTRTDACFAFVVLDIDGFKQINDHYGRELGDSFLVKASERIRRVVGEGDVLARAGADEFLLMLREADLDRIDALAEALRDPFILDGFEIFSSASIGVALFPEHGADFETLRRNADRAMGQIKRAGAGGAALFRQEWHETETERVLAEQRLRLAIKDRLFRCAFQPKVDIATEEVYGVEALVRLIDEDGEAHGPGAFIPLATELGLMDEVTHLILEEATASIDAITEAFGARATISVNIPAKQAADLDFMGSVADLLERSGSPERFVVEVTEDAFVAKNRFQSQIVPMLRQIGVRVSIDDFGTGYSSLSALADITADELKVDRSFITKIHERPRSQIVLRAIESLGAALGMTVIAEGVESFEELLYLKSSTRIRYVQGFYYARPLMFDEPAPKRRTEGRTAGRAPQRRVASRRSR
ncbi:diguanylate cyclase (GGDEF)-like protein [Rhodoblastus acidophilus]|uniref:putative bifunctional diguanylate cyclase/phosphodiesterase n=1 Tax=Rhodoblastus acidophilus TaxID=1074 RepID=UPI00222587D4|nr:EAL domain-containing protein [Rhodoblastus acidophilus]MCW2285990.1 diguanylate cyclase (GGDEF)-like protein [Rhodoblastus acidophilus]MCW2334884.1 diguanylate cyclase (GGDEF)-like protein [Rhodoblastus acidophilus]